MESHDPNYCMAGYQALAAAIIEQAAKDANGYTPETGKGKNDKNAKERRKLNRGDQMREVKKFFCDPNGLFNALSTDKVVGEAVYNQIMENYRKYGKYLPQAEYRKRKKEEEREHFY